MLSLSRLRFEHRHPALGIGTPTPRLSWQVQTDLPNWLQAAYEVECRGERVKVQSNQSVLVDWMFSPLRARERVEVRVRVWGVDGSASDWSEPASVEAGLFQPEAWSAKFITPAWDENPEIPQPLPFLRREFDVRPGVVQARLYLTAHGLYEAHLNGASVSDEIFSPGFTVYSHRLRYQTCDVTTQLKPGRNALGVILADGWYRGRFGYYGARRCIYGDRLALLAQLEITYADGSTERILSDGTWRATTGPILESELYDGETYDARLDLGDWAYPGYDDRAWQSVRPIEADFSRLVASSGPPVRRIETIQPVAVLKSPSGKTILDFGQNLVGRLRIRVQGKAGQTITLRHAEVLENGELALRPLRTAKATDRYTLRGCEAGPETARLSARGEAWEPRFTYHGFRYAEVDGWPGELNPSQISAVVCHTDLERTGWFECSDPLLNRLHENVVWSMRGNFFDIPTDCPQRDERKGWTGDIQVFAPTAAFLYDVAGFLQSWLADLAVEQEISAGVVPFIVPNAPKGRIVSAAGWGDAATTVPWVLYQRYGDKGILAAQFESMCAWVETISKLAGEKRLWDTGFQFGDWLDPAAPPDKPGEGRTPAKVVATAYFVRSAEITELAAGILGRAEEQTRYLKLADEIRAAFNAEYVTPNGLILGDSATAYSLALEFNLLPTPVQRQRAGQRLVELVRASEYHISTGFVGTLLVCDALCRAGDFETAFRLLTETTCPSWLYPVTMGATTIWERWDSLLPDGSVNPGEMTSFNHYALGAVADWMQRTLGGLAPAEPGYRRLEIHPRPAPGLTHATVRHLTPYGVAESSWSLANGEITVRVVVPPNVTATVILPGKESQPIEIGAGNFAWAYPSEKC